MPGYTTYYGFPYPLSGDPIYLGATQQKNMADSIDGALRAAGIPAVAQTNPPRAQCSRTTMQSIPNNTDTLIAFNFKNHDSEAVRVPASPMYVAGNNYIKIRVAGLYAVSLLVVLGASGGARNARLLYNGSASGPNTLTVTPPITGGDTMSLQGQWQFGVGDEIRAMVWQNSGGSVNLFGPTSSASWYTRMSVTYLGAFSA